MSNPYRAARLFAVAGLMLSGLGAPLRAAQDPDQGDVVQNGEWLYVRNCESCHGTDGDGQGPLSLAMGRPARSFADGGFAFGNTRESMFRVVSAGMPGSQMPGFLGTLSEAQRWLIVDYVRENLMPEQPPEELAAAVMIVSDRPRFARGYLPPIAEGAPMRPRGLLVGLREGLTFEYRIDDVRLLGVRLGGFCERSDWGGRGGTPLRPLGQLIHTAHGGDPPATFELVGGGTPAELTSCWVQGGTPHLRYLLLKGHQRQQVYVVETLRPEGLTVGPGFTREFVLDANSARPRLALFLCDSAPESEWMLPLPENNFESDQWFVRKREDGYEHILVRTRTDATLIRDRASLRVGFELLDRAEANLALTYFKTLDWSSERLEALAREIGR